MDKTKHHDDPLHVQACGSGGVEELGHALDDATVSWSLLRFQVGSGSFARVKFVTILCNGDDTSTVKRGRLNARTAEAIGLIGHSHVTFEVKRGAELTFELLLEECQTAFKIDDMGDFSVEGLKAEYDKTNREIQANRMAALRKAAKALEDEAEAAKAAAAAEAADAAEAAEADAAAVAAEDEEGEAGSKKKKRNKNAVTLDDALTQVGTAWGGYNWVLIDAANLGEVFDLGDHGLEEMKEALDPEKVLFGGIRFTFPREDDSPPIMKFMLVHWIGPQVSAVKRGQLNSKLDVANTTIRHHFDCTLQKTAHDRDDLEAMDLLTELKRLTYDTGAGGVPLSLEWYFQGIEAEMTFKQTKLAMASGAPPTPPAPAAEEVKEEEEEPAAPPRESLPPKKKQPELSEAIGLVREPDGVWNWTILTTKNDE